MNGLFGELKDISQLDELELVETICYCVVQIISELENPALRAFTREELKKKLEGNLSEYYGLLHKDQPAGIIATALERLDKLNVEDKWSYAEQIIKDLDTIIWAGVTYIAIENDGDMPFVTSGTTNWSIAVAVSSIEGKTMWSFNVNDKEVIDAKFIKDPLFSIEVHGGETSVNVS